MRGWRGRLVTHPVTVLALVLWWANDHVFKRAWPGWVTGKLSDVCGVWVVAAVVAAALGLVRIGVGITVAAFAVVKTLPGAALLVAPLLGGVTRRDPTDLVALLVLVPMPRVAHGLPRAWCSFAAGASPGMLCLVVLGAAFTTSATSCDSGGGVDRVGLTARGEVAARIDGQWPAVPSAQELDTEDVRPSSDSSRCAEGVCFEATADAVLRDGEVVFEWSADELEQIGWRDGCDHPTTEFLDVVAVSTPDRPEAWVAIGGQGVLHIAADGSATRVGVGSAQPYEFTVVWFKYLNRAPLVCLVVATLPLIAIRRRLRLRTVLFAILANGGLMFIESRLRPRPESLVASSDNPAEWGTTIFWWTVVLQVPWIISVISDLQSTADDGAASGEPGATELSTSPDEK